MNLNIYQIIGPYLFNTSVLSNINFVKMIDDPTYSIFDNKIDFNFENINNGIGNFLNTDIFSDKINEIENSINQNLINGLILEMTEITNKFKTYYGLLEPGVNEASAGSVATTAPGISSISVNNTLIGNSLLSTQYRIPR